MQRELLDIIRRQLYTRKLDMSTGKIIVDNELLFEFQDAVKKNNDRIISTISSSASQYFHVINHLQGDVSELTYNANMLSCLLPKKLIVTSFVEQENFKYLLASLYERFKLPIENSIIELYIDTDKYPTNWTPSNNKKKPETLEKSNIHLLTQSYNPLNYDNYIKIALPWLINARHEDYIELIDKYSLQFDNYSKQIDKITKVAKTPDELSHLLVSEIKDAFIDIRISLEKTQAELYKKGLKTFVGAVATAIPFLVPIDNSIISPELLGSILGATNIFSTIPPIIDSGFDLTRAGRDNPYWLLWKWNRAY